MTASDSISVQIWHWYSIDQLRAASIFARRARELERNPPPPSAAEKANGLTWPVATVEEHRSSVIAAITSAVGFLEASINELFASAKHDNLEVGGRLPTDERKILSEAREMVDTNRLLDRFQLCLMTLGKPILDRGSQPHQDAQLLVSLRNELVHYKPVWREGGIPNAIGGGKVSVGLSQKGFPLHPFTREGNPFFPDRCLGAACAAWARDAAVALSDEFFRRLGVLPVYDRMRSEIGV
jgi:hypothetical protein